MSVDVKNQGAPNADADAGQGGGDDRFKNLQAEMDRKLGNIHSELKKSQEALLSQLAAMNKPKQQEQAPADDIEDLFYKSPKGYTSKVMSEVDRLVEAKLSTRDQSTQKQQQVLGQLMNDFPELTDNSHDLTKLAVEKFQSLPDSDKASPIAYRTAVADAALELGIRPKSKRTVEDDTFSLPSGGSSSRTQERRANKENDKRMEQLADLFGIDAKRVKARADKRKNYTSWE